VLGANNSNFRNSSVTQFFNPTHSTPPFFQIFEESFKSLLGSSPSLHLIASNDSYSFAHEAPIWVESTDEVFFAANAGGALGLSDIDHNSKVGKISLREAEKALSALGNNGMVQVNVTEVGAHC
jgi:gluconolactonase